MYTYTYTNTLYIDETVLHCAASAEVNCRNCNVLNVLIVPNYMRIHEEEQALKEKQDKDEYNKLE